MSKAVEKLEDKGSDESSGEEGRITLSLSHLDSDHSLGSDNSGDKGSIQSVARRSVYTPRPLTRKSSRESSRSSARDSVQSSSRPPAKRSFSPAKKANPEARARKSRAGEEDVRSGEVLRLESDTFKIRKWETASWVVHSNIIFDRKLVPELKKESLTPIQSNFFCQKQQVYISHCGFPSNQEINIFICPSSVGITLQCYSIAEGGARGSK